MGQADRALAKMKNKTDKMAGSFGVEAEEAGSGSPWAYLGSSPTSPMLQGALRVTERSQPGRVPSLSPPFFPLPLPPN